MPISASAIVEIRATATAGNVNGCFFVTGASGVDYSQQDAAQYALTGVTSSGAGDTVLTASAAADMVGNGLFVVSGTNFATNRYFEIVSVVVGVSITCATRASGGSISTGIGASGVMNIGGAASLNSTLDDDLFEEMQAGNIVYVRGASGTVSLGEGISLSSTAGTLATSIKLIGYNTSRGDTPTGANRPTFSQGANAINFSNATWDVFNCIFTGTASTVVTSGPGSIIRNCKFINTSTTANRNALGLSTTGRVINSEMVSQNGYGILMGSGNAGAHVQGCYVHDSAIGIGMAGFGCSVIQTLVTNNRTTAIEISASNLRGIITNCTLYGSEAKVGVGIKTTQPTASSTMILNNIIYGFDTGIEVSTLVQDSIFEDYNTFFNNTTNRTLCNTGPNSVTTNPGFLDAAQITGATATTSGSTLTQSGGNFSTVTDNTDYLRVVSGTGVTVGMYLITSHTTTTLTVNNALGTSSAGDVVYAVAVGSNFAAASAPSGTPGTYNGNDTVSNLKLGIAQRAAAGGSAFGVFA